MYKFIIVEDEEVAADNLVRMLSVICPGCEIVARIESTKDAIKMLPIAQYDLVFMDIRLTDGDAFVILDQIELNKPIIFTTAYDQYVLKAFKYLSIDFLLKPIDQDELKNAIDKFQKHFLAEEPTPVDLIALQQMLKNETSYKERFLVQIGKKLKPVSIENINYFYSADKITFLNAEGEKSYPIELSLAQLEKELNPNQFFRISRQFIISRRAIQHMHMLSPSKMKVVLFSDPNLDLYVSIDRMARFKHWLK